MKTGCKVLRLGYTVVELMVTVVIVAVLATTLGTFVVKLLTIQENEREEAYIREKLADLCGLYADALSIGSFFGFQTNVSDRATVVKYRQEAGGVSLETGVVTRVSYLMASVDERNGAASMKAYALEPNGLVEKFLRTVNGDAQLIPLTGDLIDCMLTPLGLGDGPITTAEGNPYFGGFQMANTALAYLQVSARYRIRNENGDFETRKTSVGRIVRLWNHE